MFATPEEVMTVTPYEDVTMTEVIQAQFVIEVHVGRAESEVDSSHDKNLLARAVIAQVVYMRDNPEVTFEQVGASYISRGQGQTTFSSPEAPFVAPLALMACKHLSWKQSRSVKIGKTTVHIKRDK